MPTVLYVKGYRFYFYAGDENEPAHVHVEKGDGNAKIWLEPVLDAKYFHSFKNQEKKDIMKIVEENYELLKSKWNDTLHNKYDTIEYIIFEKGLRIKAVHFHADLDLMLIVLNNKKVIQRTISSSPRLARAKMENLNNYRLISGGVGIHWPDVDEDLSLKGFIKEEIFKESELEMK